MDCDVLFKIVVIGDSGVGKSNLITRYTRDHFTKDSKSTIGVEFASKLIEYDGVKIKGQIWDTAGQDRFRAIAAAYYRGAHGALIVYDITNPNSFQNLESWFKEIQNQGELNCINVLVGNKCDLKELRQVETADGIKYAEKRNIRFVETSAADNTNVDMVFTTLMQDIYKNQRNRPRDDDDDNTPQKPTFSGPTEKTVDLSKPVQPVNTKGDQNCQC